MAFAVQGFAAIAQNFVSQNIASNFYPRCQFLSALGSFTLTRNKKTSLNIGRPEGGEWLSGRQITKADQQSIPLVVANGYQTRIQQFETNNSKWMAARDTNPVVANATTNSHGQVGQAAALFYRARLKTPILIWHTDKARAGRSGTEKGQQLGMAQLINEATEVAYQEHVKELNSKIWNGSPTSQSLDPWDQPLGITAAFSASNTYGNVDRTTIPSTSAWNALVDSTITAVDLNKIVNDANVTKGIADLNGRGIDFAITTKDLYLKFKNQLISQGAVGVRIVPDGLPGMAALGVKQETLCLDNVTVMYDTQCAANTVLGFDMSCWNMIIDPASNLSITPFRDLSEYAEGAKDADQAFLTTEFILACSNPGLQVKYSAIGT
jgi:hypothetical protein